MLELLQQAFEVYKNGGDVALENWYNALPPKKRKQYTHEFSASVIAIKKGLEAAKEYLDKFASAQQSVHPTSGIVRPSKRFYTRRFTRSQSFISARHLWVTQTVGKPKPC